jgi:hypothetical protein
MRSVKNMPRLILTTALGLMCCVLACDWFEDPVRVNIPPETELLLCPGSVVVLVDDHVALAWQGRDPDGTVEAYQWSFDGAEWVLTADDSSLFGPLTAGQHTIEVRAVDDDGAVDPSPALCKFTVQLPGQLADRVVLVELFTTAVCTYCPRAEDALLELIGQIGRSNLCVVAYHDKPAQDQLATPETVARIDWYTDDPDFPGEEGVWPTAVFDGLRVVEGALTVAQAKADYDPEIASRQEVGSPLTVRVEGEVGTESGSVTVTVRVEDQLPNGSLTLRMAVVENDVLYTIGPPRVFDFVVRDILTDEPLSLTTLGDSIKVTRGFALEDGWDRSEIDLIAFVQHTSTREVVQAARMKAE